MNEYSESSLNVVDRFLETATLNEMTYNETNLIDINKSFYGIFLVIKISPNF